MQIQSTPNPITISLKRANDACIQLQNTDKGERNRAIVAMANGLEKSFEDILEANTLDLEISREMAVPSLILDWLKLTPERLEKTVKLLNCISELADPTDKLISSNYQVELAQTYCQLVPLGVIAFVYEAFPELAALAAAMCLKTGNSLILRGGGEASHVNAVIAKVLKTVVRETGLPNGCIEYLSSEDGTSIADLIVQNQYLNLIIPYGRPGLVQQVTEQATAPVLKTTMGNCYLYWASSGDLDLVRWVLLDSHASEPDPVNAIEKVIVSVNQKPSSLVRIFNNLSENNFKLKGDEILAKEFPEHLSLAKESEWNSPFLDRTIAFKLVENIDAGISFINQYSSGHADCLISESYAESRQFAREIDSALIYINSSPRFYRYSKRGESVFLGISNQKGYRRGLIGLETLTTRKEVIQGD